MIKLLWVITNIEYGGGERTFELLAHALPPEAFSLHVACDTANPFWERMGALGVCRHAIRFEGTWGPGRVRALAKIIAREHVQLIHAQSRRAEFYALLAARLCHVPVISSVAARTAMFGVSGMRGWLYRRIEAWMERQFTLQIAVSRTVQEALRRSGVDSTRVVCIPEAIDVEQCLRQSIPKHEACQRLRLDPAKVWVGTLGRMIPLKGHRLLLEAADRLRDQTQLGFLLAGAGPLEAQLHALAGSLSLGDRLQILPFQDDPSVLYSALDLLVFPSLYGEAFPRVLLEAMAYGKPILASDLPASREVVGGGAAAQLFPPGNVSALATAMRQMLQDPASLQRLGALARQYAVDHHDVARYIPRVVEVYRSVLTRP